ncbi:uncharacterized protein [Nicotiana tomentosiformis]|uniref:uncharacterized protein n=1 Tax=Nicotiana tomentosiformis TaxID=4098 RepID=UPI00388C599F
MANPSKNSSSLPKETTPTPSITPSTIPLSKKGRTKLLARKTVAGSTLSKKLDKQLKDSQVHEPQKSEDSFKSATEGEETVSSEIEQVATNLENRFVLVGSMPGIETTESGKVGGKNKKGKEKESEGARSTVRGKEKGVVGSSPTPVSLTKESGAMVVLGEESAGIEESVRKMGGSGFGEAVEGQETFADLLKRVTASYNPKKKGSSGVNTPGTARANKKRKAASSIPVEIPPTRGRATRSQKKQSEDELEKALEESKRKNAAKGKKNMGEPVDAVEIDEIDLVLRDEDEMEEMKVLTPKAKEAKTSTKKSAVKSRKVKIVEEEEWSGEEEEDDFDAEKDKMVKFGKRTILKGRLLRDLEEEGTVMLLEKL